MTLVEHLLEQGEQLFDKRTGLLSLWQEVAENFYPERADFTVNRSLGADFASNLMTSYPALARRDQGNAIGSILRPSSKEWKHLRTSENWDRLDVESRQWLEWAERRMGRAMSHRTSMFARATKEGDHDFATFGQAVIQVTLNPTATGMLYRCWHLRDCAWVEGADGGVNTLYRCWKPTIRQLSVLFKGKLHPEMQRKLEKQSQTEAEIWHVVLPSDDCAYGEKVTSKYRSVYLDVANKHVIEDVGVFEQEYIVPRWQTVSGSQYAYSPATVVALPDARLIQSMTAVLLDAGENAVQPPLLAVREALRGDINIYPGGITYVDMDYDERLGSVLRPLQDNAKNAIPIGIELLQDSQKMIAEAFYLNKLTLPSPESSMTAYEVGQRVQEYIRQAMPLFEPMEAEYNAPLCEVTFNKMLRAGAFGSPMDMPKGLRNKTLEFVFESPLHDATDREKGQRFIETAQMLAQAQALDPTAAYVIDAPTALRDVLKAIGVPALWTNSEGKAKELADAAKQAQQTAQTLQLMQGGADVAKTLTEATPNAALAQGG